MKRLLSITLFLLWAGVGIVFSAKPAVIENPPFFFNTHSNVTVERIVLDESSTSLYMVVYQSKGNWIRIASDSYIYADGKKQMLKEANGISLDQEIYPDESGKIVFSLIFPPVEPATQQIDFIESDCDNCFKIYGLNINPEAKHKRITVSQKIKNKAIVKEDGKSLEKPLLKSGNAVLKGGFIGYTPSMSWKVNVYVNNPVTGMQEELGAKLKEDGSFEMEVPLVASMQVLLRVTGGLWYNKYILLSPGKESSVYFDLQQKSCQETPIESLKCPPAKYVYFGGACAEINNQTEDINFAELLHPIYNQDDNVIVNMSAQQYKSYILDKASALNNELAQKGLTKKNLEFAAIVIRCATVHRLMFTDYDLKNAFRKVHNIDNYNDPLTGFEKPEINDDFYSFLKELSINDPYCLYSANYSGIINSCKYMDNKTIHLNYNLTEDYQALIDSGKLAPEDLEMAAYLRDIAWDNPNSPNKELTKETWIVLVNEIINIGKLNDKRLKDADKALALCTDPATTAATAIEQTIQLYFNLVEDEVLTDEERNKLNSIMKSTSQKETPGKFSSEQMSDFHQKYTGEINLMLEKRQIKEKLSYLARILGTDQGIAPNLMETQLISTKMEELTPLTNNDLKKFSQLKNPFYFDYLRTKNEQLIAQIEKNKHKTNYTIHETPNTDAEQTFSEIVKQFEGKVILIDFWNTWCSPCRSAMKRFSDSKNVFKEKGVVFIYLADDSSPLTAWNNMIGDIQGEHWRLKSNQMKVLKEKFRIRGIPSYLILNKQGEQIYFREGFIEDEIKNKLTEALL